MHDGRDISATAIQEDPVGGTSGWSFCSRLTAIHADTGDAWAASI
jgi:hypothetical protein